MQSFGILNNLTFVVFSRAQTSQGCMWLCLMQDMTEIQPTLIMVPSINHSLVTIIIIIIRRVSRSINSHVELYAVVMVGGGAGQGGRDYCHCLWSPGSYNPVPRPWCMYHLQVLQPTDLTKIEEYYCAHDSHSGGGNSFHEAIAKVFDKRHIRHLNCYQSISHDLHLVIVTSLMKQWWWSRWGKVTIGLALALKVGER